MAALPPLLRGHQTTLKNKGYQPPILVVKRRSPRSKENLPPSSSKNSTTQIMSPQTKMRMVGRVVHERFHSSSRSQSLATHVTQHLNRFLGTVVPPRNLSVVWQAKGAINLGFGQEFAAASLSMRNPATTCLLSSAAKLSIS